MSAPPEYPGPWDWEERARARGPGLLQLLGVTFVQAVGLGAVLEHAQAGAVVWLVGWLLAGASYPERAPWPRWW